MTAEERERELLPELERYDDELLEELEREWIARRQFPQLSPTMLPRESDESPTYWGDV